MAAMTTPMTLLYMAHPIAGDVPANMARAKRWLRWLGAHVDNAVMIAPYLHDLELEVTRDHVPAERELGLRRCVAAVAICDGIVLVGGRISPGMQREMASARTVYDLTELGPVPPDDDCRLRFGHVGDVAAVLRMRAG